LRELLATVPVIITDLLTVAALSTVGYAAIRLDRRVYPAHRPDRAGP
jgi:Ca2+-transporting ATPase